MKWLIACIYFIYCRCVQLVPQANILPHSCEQFYNVSEPPANGIINESRKFPDIRRDLDRLLSSISNTTDSCAQLIQHYFCQFYYPSCDVDTGIITPVCRGSCTLLFNNEDCFDLLIGAIEMMDEEKYPVPSDNSCEMTFLPIPEPAVADNCISIEG